MTQDERARWDCLSPEQQAFVLSQEPLWRRAHEIASRNAGVDVSDVYHVLATWHETPTQRLGRAFRRGQLLSRAR